MASLNVTISGTWNAADFSLGRGSDTRGEIMKVAGLLEAIAKGVHGGTVTVVPGTADAVAASSDVTATTSGSLGVIVNGTTVTTSFATSQDVTATNAVADINANTTVNKLVVATKGATGHLTVTAKVPGDAGNACTLTVTGTGAAATGSGKLAGGTGTAGTVSTYALP